MDIRQNPYLLGQIALQEGFLTRDKLEQGLQLQAMAKAAKPIGSILVQAGHLTEAQLAEILRIQESRFEQLLSDPARGGLFGQLAVRLGYVTRPQIHEALREQEAAGRDGSSLLLGQILLRKKYLTPDQFLELLRRQKKDVTVSSAPPPENC
ncbi:MAG: hypothetical protein L0170_04575 [Acidobacteria bacterium]|nr:hypothetical protein [Acidobacteriota bacterium]